MLSRFGNHHVNTLQTLLCLLASSTILVQGKTPMTAKNILGKPLESCSKDPLTGFFRDGFCNTSEDDHGTHVVCAVVTDQFLTYTKSQGNDLSTPNPLYRFPGLKAGDRWCLCALRWKQAYEAGAAPMIDLESTHEKALQFIDKKTLLAHKLTT